jgi:hypothetical protein
MGFTQLTERAWGPLAQVFLPVRGFLVPLALSGVVEVGCRTCRRALGSKSARILSTPFLDGRAAARRQRLRVDLFGLHVNWQVCLQVPGATTRKEEFGDTAASAAEYNGYRLVNGDPSG